MFEVLILLLLIITFVSIHIRLDKIQEKLNGK